MKKFNKIETTEPQDRVISNLFILLYPDHTFYFAGNGLLCIHKKTDNNVKFIPQLVIHWYELMVNNIFSDLATRFDNLERSACLMLSDEALYIISEDKDALEEILYERDRYTWESIFEILERVIINIKKYEQIISNGGANGQGDNNGKESVSSIQN